SSRGTLSASTTRATDGQLHENVMDSYFHFGRRDAVKVPIRYGRKSTKSGYTMVFARSCSEAARLGTGLVVPVRAECCEPEHLFEEAEHLWAAERNEEQISGFC